MRRTISIAILVLVVVGMGVWLYEKPESQVFTAGPAAWEVEVLLEDADCSTISGEDATTTVCNWKPETHRAILEARGWELGGGE